MRIDMKEVVVVTGGGGFIGHYLVRRLLRENLVVVLDNFSRGTPERLKGLEDQVLRSKAEVQNVRRIAAQEVTKARLFGIESLAREFLAVGDNLERAILSCQDNEDSDVIQEGLELTLKSLETSLKSSGIEVIDCENQIFDPVKHEAISVLENNDLETNTIIDVVQKGYTIMDRTLRPAKVVVSKKS